MASYREYRKNIDFKSVQICKDIELGKGAYGCICKAKLGDLVCAAKLHYAIIYQDSTVHMLVRFQRECELLASCRHPNIIQYLGTTTDPDHTHIPVLLTELMDKDLRRMSFSASSLPLGGQYMP